MVEAMKHQGEEAGRIRRAPAGMPGTRYLLATCGLVATAVYLGAQWLRHPIAGLPAGMWVIAVAQAAGYAWSLRTARRRMLAPERGARLSLPLAPGAPASAGLAGLDMGVVLGRMGAAAWECVRGLGYALGVTPDRMNDAEGRAAEWLDRGAADTKGLRIGLDVGPELNRALRTLGAEGAPVQWVQLPVGAEAGSMMRRLRLDAVVRQEAGQSLAVIAAESDSRDAAWYDWGTARPLTYGSVFPTRVDPARVTIADVDAADVNEAAVLYAVVIAAATLSRIEPRLSLTDRLRGRSPCTSMGADSPAHQRMMSLARVLAASSAATPVRKAAARAVSAFVAASDAWIPPEERRAAVRAAMVVAGDEPEVQLRAAAVGLSCDDDAMGFAALGRASSLLRSGGTAAEVDHLAFLQSEVECGSQGPLTLGRVASGVALVCATSAAERVPFIRADFMDDVRYSAWLVGRDQDRAVLFEVFRLMEGGAGQARAAA
jgi:hypothetical protein